MSDWEGLSPPYATVVADPPWPYPNANKPGSKIGAERFVADGSRRMRSIADWTFSPMPIEDICGMDVAALAAPDAHLYLWTTNAFIEQAHAVARAWGFAVKTVLTWVKVQQDDPARVSMKAGHYFRGATEHALFCVRGSMPLQTDDALPTAYLWPRIGTHSRKPAAFYDLVERCSPGPRLELFARQPRLGWDHWGHGYEGAK